MHRKLSLLPLTALATILAAPAAHAAEWHHAKAAPSGAAAAPDARAAAESYFQHAAGELRLEHVALRYRNELVVGARRTVRFTQAYAGLPVLDAAAVVSVGPDQQVETVVLEVARGLTVSPVPAIGEAAAAAIVEARLGVTLEVAPRMELAVLPEGAGKLVWIADVATARGGDRYLVDAHAGKILRERPLAVDALGRVYPISSVNTPVTEDVLLPPLVPSVPQTLNGWDGNLAVTNYVSGNSMGNVTVEQTLAPNSGEDFLYDPPVDPLDGTDAFAQVGLFYHLGRIRDYFATRHAIDFSPASWKVTAVANMQEDGQPMDNAFFSPMGTVAAPFDAPNMMAIGQGSVLDFADDSDVFLHEFGHYVSHNAIGYNQGQLGADAYGLSPWGGSIDEGIADYFACTINGDSILGEASLAPFGAERDLTDVSKVCPNDVFGEVHEDGEIIGSVGWSLREAFGQDAGDRLVWGALTMLTPGTSFGDFARALQMVAGDLVADGTLTAADAATVDEILTARGLTDCDKVLAVSEAQPRETIMFGLDLISQFVGLPCSTLQGQVSLQSLFHFEATPAATDQGVRFAVDLDVQGSGSLRWNIYVRAGQHVGFGSGGFLPVVQDYDYAVEALTDTHGEIVIDANSNPPFDPSQKYYMVVGHANCPLSVATVTSGPATPGGEGGAGGAGGGGTGGAAGEEPKADPETVDGCSCSVVGDGAASPWAALSALALVGAAFGRRSRRARRG